MAYPLPQPDPTKVVGRRVLALLLDAIIIIVPAILFVTADFEYIEVDNLQVSGEQFCDDYLDQSGGFCFNAEDIDDRVYFSDGNSPAGTAWYWLANFLALVVLQGFTGWTPGKLISGIRVIGEDGQKPGFVKALLRWLLWIVDGFPWFIPGLTGFIVAVTTTGHRRVGDMVAKTFVVRRAAAGTPMTISNGQLVVGAPAPAVAAPAWAPAVAATGAPVAPPVASAPAPAPPTEGPQWDEARGTYIQWDPTQGVWMQWDEGFKAWTQIPGQ